MTCSVGFVNYVLRFPLVCGVMSCSMPSDLLPRHATGGCHEAKNQSLFIAYSNDLGVTLGVTNQEGLVLHVTHRCVKLLHTRISWCHIWPFPLCNLWHQCDTRCDTKTLEYATKSDCLLASWRYLFCLLVPGIIWSLYHQLPALFKSEDIIFTKCRPSTPKVKKRYLILSYLWGKLIA